MWASCCGLLNEVMGTGSVRAQQPGFGAGAGPFRFAPSAGYSTYPPTSSGSAAQLCKACGLAFSVFRRKVKKPAAAAFPGSSGLPSFLCWGLGYVRVACACEQRLLPPLREALTAAATEPVR